MTYSVTLVRGQRPVYEGQMPILVDGKQSGESEKFDPKTTLGARVRADLASIMESHPHLNKLQLIIN